jgi:hypothetical protein
MSEAVSGDITTRVTVCTACGCVVGQEAEDWERHENWHRLIRNLTAAP